MTTAAAPSPPPSITSIAEELRASSARLERLAPRSATARSLSRLFSRLDQRLARPPRIILLGEFNAGKTTLANALIGADLLPTSIHANTRLPLHVRYSPEPTLTLELADNSRRPLDAGSLHLLRGDSACLLHVGLPVDRLRQFELIDTPGLASGMSRLDGVNLRACARANIAIWCTASTQAWKATEQTAWGALPDRLRRSSVLVATLADRLNSERDRSRVEARLRGEVAAQFTGMAMVAAAEIDELRRNPAAPDHAARWISSGGEAIDAIVERLVQDVLTGRENGTRRVLSRVAARHPADQTAPDPAASRGT